MSFLEELIYLTDSNTIRTLSGKPKRLYKYAVVATFFNIVNGKHMQYGQFENIGIVRDILKDPKAAYKKYDLKLC